MNRSPIWYEICITQTFKRIIFLNSNWIKYCSTIEVSKEIIINIFKLRCNCLGACICGFRFRLTPCLNMSIAYVHAMCDVVVWKSFIFISFSMFFLFSFILFIHNIATIAHIAGLMNTVTMYLILCIFAIFLNKFPKYSGKWFIWIWYIQILY